MFTYRLLVLSTLMLISALSTHAQGVDPLWLKVKAQIEQTNNFVASEVSAHTEIIDGDGKNQDTIDKKTRLTGWKNGEPVRSVVSSVETHKSALGDAQFDQGLANHPEKVLAGILTVERQGETILDSTLCVVFKVTGQLVKKRKISFTGTIWVEKTTGLPLRIDYYYDPSHIPMTKAMNESMIYASAGQGRWLPKTDSIDILMSIMFMKFKMTIKQSFDGWVLKP